MKALEFSHVLRSLEPLIADPSERSAATKIADAFSRGGSTTVATLLKRMTAARSTLSGGPNVVTSLGAGQLRRTLSCASKFLSAAGAKSAAGDLQSLADALPASSETSLASWIEALNNSLDGPPKKAKGSKGPSLPPAEQIETYARRFNDAGFDEAAFLAAHSALSADATVKVAEAKEIVHQVTQLTRKHASKKKALEFLLEDFYGRLRRHNELASVSKARPW